MGAMKNYISKTRLNRPFVIWDLSLIIPHIFSTRGTRLCNYAAVGLVHFEVMII